MRTDRGALEGTPWFPETPGETIEGVVEGRGRRDTRYGEAQVVRVGDRLVYAGTVLHHKLADVEIGDRVRIEFLGFRGQRSYRDFRVTILSGPSQTPPGAPDAALLALLDASDRDLLDARAEIVERRLRDRGDF